MDLNKKLEQVAVRHQELADALGQPDAVSDMDRFTRLNKEYSDLTPVVEAFDKLKQMQQEQIDLTELLGDSDTDEDMRSMAEEELSEIKKELPQLEEKLKLQLVPKDADDERNVILEVRAGTGGDEAGLFAAEVARMYMRYAENNKWQVEVMDQSETGVGGLKELIAQISGVGAYGRLKFESGVHRVQRVPETESQGRVHTSAVTVAVLPEAEEADMDVPDKDLRIDVYRASGPGGQSVNTTDSAVRITHIPTGLIVTCQDEKSQHKNKAKALKVMYARLYDMEQERLAKERADVRKSQVGSGDRSERIRTYNFPQSRITDHRINLTLHNLHDVLAGDKLDDVIEPLITEDQAAKLAALGEEDA
jgi:peptide chain release factor 1